MALKSQILDHPPLSDFSSQEIQRAAIILSKLINRTSSIKTEAEFLEQALDLISSEMPEMNGLFLACPGRFLYSKSPSENEKFLTVRCFLENLSALNMEGISPSILESLPELDSTAVTLLRSPITESCRLVFIAIGSPDPVLGSLWNLSEPWIRLHLQRFQDQNSNHRKLSFLKGIHQGSGNMMQNLLNQSQLIPSLLEDALRTLNATGCAILFPREESFQDYVVPAQTGLEGSTPIPNALFSQAMIDFQSNGNKPVLHRAGVSSEYLMVPLIQRNLTIGVLLITGSGFDQEDRQLVAASYGYLFSIAHESATLFERSASGQTEWENTFDSIADPLYIIDNEYKLKKINKSLASYSMKSIKVPPNPNCYRYLFNQTSVCSWCPVPKSMETGMPETLESPLFTTGVWQVQSFPYMDKDERRIGSINVLRDITLLNRMQEQLIETEKLASAGKLISGVAHEVRNPLFGISATVRALANELKGAPQDIQPYLEIIMSETTRLNRLMEDLLNYTRPVKIDKNPSDLTELVHEIIDHFRHLPESQMAEFSVIAGDRIPLMNMDRNKMKQVLINLFENGIQHAEQEPRVDVFLQYLSLADPPEIHLVIKDNGVGISNENLTRVFDPFFTTRQKGTGLGLSIVRKVIHDHGGRISVESHPGIGTTFRITLPVNSKHS